MRLAAVSTSLTALAACSGTATPTALETTATTTHSVPGIEVTPEPTESAPSPEPEPAPEPQQDVWPPVATVTLPATVDSSTELGPHSLAGLQRFADDLAAGNFSRVREQCWTLSEPATRSLFEHRDGVLAALQGQAQETGNLVISWEVGEHTLFASPEELRSSYSCPCLDTRYTTEDAKLLAVRVAGRLNGEPYRRSDTALDYELECHPTAPEDTEVLVETEVMVEDTGGHYPEAIAAAVRSVAEADTLESDSPRLAIFRAWDPARPDLKLVIGIDQGAPGCVIGADR